MKKQKNKKSKKAVVKNTNATAKKNTKNILFIIAAVILIGAVASVYLAMNSKYVIKIGNMKVSVDEFKYFYFIEKSNLLNAVLIKNPSLNEEDFWNTKIDDKYPVEIAKESAIKKIQEKKIQMSKAKEMGLLYSASKIRALNKSREDKTILNYGYGSKEDTEKIISDGYGISLKAFVNFSTEAAEISAFKDSIFQETIVEEEDIRKYYDSNPEWYMLDTEGRKNAEEVFWIKTIYIYIGEEESNSIQSEKLEGIKSLQDRINSGEDFETLFKDSEIQTNYDTVEYLLGKNNLDPEYKSKLYTMNEGEVSSTLLKTGNGYVILKIMEHIPEGKPVSLKCAIEYREFGKIFTAERLYDEKLNDWLQDGNFDITINKELYDSFN